MKFNVRFWQATVTAWAVASIVLYLFHYPILSSFWSDLVSQGVIRADFNSISTNALFGVGLFAGVYIMCEFLEKLARTGRKKALKYGAMFGLLVGLTEAGQALLYHVPYSLGIAYGIADIAAFAMAAVVYQQFDSGK